MEVTIQLPDAVGQQLQQFQDRLPEVIERGIQVMLAERNAISGDEEAIMALLASQPTPEQVMALTPSPELQARVSDLLARSKQGQLAAQEEKELDRYLLLEHLVRLAKVHASKHLASQP
jgi:hypothetical protein